MTLRRRHHRTLRRIFARPTPSDIRWAEIESLLIAAGVEISERAGSRVALIRRDGTVLVVHKPHPRPETGKPSVRAIATFLEEMGAVP